MKAPIARLTFTLFAIVTLAVCKESHAQQEKHIHWQQINTWDSLKAESRRSRKLIFVDAYATWCGPCKVMESAVFTKYGISTFINENFLPIRIQMDHTVNDGDDVQVRYTLAEILKETFHVSGYPTFLFIDSTGKLVHKAIGYQNETQFTALLKDAVSNPEELYNQQVKLFTEGTLELSLLPQLIRKAYEHSNPELGLKMVKHFKAKLIDKAAWNDVLLAQNLEILNEFAVDIIHLEDRYFKFLYNHPETVDSILAESGRSYKSSKKAIEEVVFKQMVWSHLYKADGSAVLVTPKWTSIQNSLTRYSQIDPQLMLLNAQIEYYETRKLWRQHLHAIAAKVEKYGVSSISQYGVSNFIVSAFIHTNDSTLLSKAASWVANEIFKSYQTQISKQLIQLQDSAIHLSGNNDLSNYACLLYKCGKKEDAIRLVECHVRLLKLDLSAGRNVQYSVLQIPIKLMILKRMRNGEVIDESWKSEWFF